MLLACSTNTIMLLFTAALTLMLPSLSCCTGCRLLHFQLVGCCAHCWVTGWLLQGSGKVQCGPPIGASRSIQRSPNTDEGIGASASEPESTGAFPHSALPSSHVGVFFLICDSTHFIRVLKCSLTASFLLMCTLMEGGINRVSMAA